MCGITGIFDLKQMNRIDADILLKMRNTLNHRGPDGATIHTDENIGLATTRLSIIDIEHGDQPLWNEDRSIVLICNGEVFNYIELREDLIKQGHTFSTNSDCEVILHLYEDRNVDSLDMLNGQFAFVLYDFKKNILFAARDHLGIIPFFYTVTEEGLFLFASEIKALLMHPQVKKQVDLIGLDQILTFPGLISPRTLFQNILSLPNGHYINIAPENTEIKPIEYWDVIYPKKHEILEIKPESYYIDTVSDLFEKSVSYRLRADVPIGFYVSGGLDSAMITSKAVGLQSLHKSTFAINVHAEELSEAKFQRLLAAHLDTTHEEIFFQPHEMLKRLKQVIYHTECPLRETYNTASLALSERVKAAGIKVVLSGEGADEFFAGYIGYRFDKINFKGEAVSETEKELRKKLWGNTEFTYEKNYTTFKETKRQLYSSQLRLQFEEFESTNHFVIDSPKIQNVHITHLRSYIDYKLRLCDHLIGDHGDRMALANGVECRYPFLDKDLIEFTATIPPDLLLHNLQEKYILKKIAYDFVPNPIIDRDKFAFATPSSIEILLQNNEYINDLLSYERIKREGYFDPDYVEYLKNVYRQPDFKIHVPYEPDLLITVITFGMFREIFDLPCL